MFSNVDKNQVVGDLAHFPEYLEEQHQHRVVDPGVQLVAAVHCAGACRLALPQHLRKRKLTHPSRLFAS
uniref:SFRICE_030193 n=1 Tax=Spodoptera frugiperda TaxID=7108 RepID=A0A2H1WTE0_SPOFR